MILTILKKKSMQYFVPVTFRTFAQVLGITGR